MQLYEGSGCNINPKSAHEKEDFVIHLDEQPGKSEWKGLSLIQRSGNEINPAFTLLHHDYL